MKDHHLISEVNITQAKYRALPGFARKMVFKLLKNLHTGGLTVVEGNEEHFFGSRDDDDD